MSFLPYGREDSPVWWGSIIVSSFAHVGAASALLVSGIAIFSEPVIEVEEEEGFFTILDLDQLANTEALVEEFPETGEDEPPDVPPDEGDLPRPDSDDLPAPDEGDQTPDVAGDDPDFVPENPDSPLPGDADGLDVPGSDETDQPAPPEDEVEQPPAEPDPPVEPTQPEDTTPPEPDPAEPPEAPPAPPEPEPVPDEQDPPTAPPEPEAPPIVEDPPEEQTPPEVIENDPPIIEDDTQELAVVDDTQPASVPPADDGLDLLETEPAGGGGDEVNILGGDDGPGAAPGPAEGPVVGDVLPAPTGINPLPDLTATTTPPVTPTEEAPLAEPSSETTELPDETDQLALLVPEVATPPIIGEPEDTGPDIPAADPDGPTQTDPLADPLADTGSEEGETEGIEEEEVTGEETGGEAGGPRFERMAAPSQTDILIGDLLRRVRATPERQCVLSLPRRTTSGAGLAMVGADRALLDEVAERITDGLSETPAQSREVIDGRQCAALDILLQAESYPAARIGVDLDTNQLDSGETLVGRVLGAEGLFLSLLLVDDNGVVQDLAPFTEIRGNTPVFEVPVARSGSPRDTRQVILALGTRTGPLDVAPRIGQLAEDVFAPLSGESLSDMVFGIATIEVR